MFHSAKGSRNIFLLVCTAFLFFSNAPAEDTIEIQIQVSPNTLNLQNAGEWVTIHTDLAYSSVNSASVQLNGVEISWSKSDNQGYFVAKFVMSEIKDLAGLKVGEYNSLTLTGESSDGLFTGTQAIMVISVIPKKYPG
ncbi:hypothetical protein GX408_00555 [bacterium]|nr:hypothetical protein [bacterium]